MKPLLTSPYTGAQCGLNFCARPQGGGTWTRVHHRPANAEPSSTVVPVCEEHWQALRVIR